MREGSPRGARAGASSTGASIGSAPIFAIAALAIAAFAIRLALRIDHDEDLDALRFRLGVERFDPAALRPHAPFYPVYIAAAKLIAALGASPRLALACVSAGAGAAVTALTALLAFEILGRRAALIAGALALASPLLWITAEKLLSDMAGAAVVMLGIWLLARARRLPEEAARLRTTAMVVLGVSLGTRLSYFPFALAAAIAIARAEGGRRAYAARARDLATGVVIWLVPLVIAGKPKPLVAAAIAQGIGHFTRWGGTALTISSPSARASAAAWGIWANVLGGAFPDAPPLRWIGAPLILIFLALAARRAIAARARIPPEIAAAAAAYVVWAALGQNTVYKPRHWIPLAPLFVVTLAAGADAIAARARLGAIAAGVLAAQWFIDGWSLAAAHRALSPAAALVRFAEDEAPRDPRPILSREVARLLEEGAPDRRIVAVRDDADLVAAALASGPEGALVTSEILSDEAVHALLGRGFTLSLVFSRPRSRYIDALWTDLGLYAARRAGPDLRN